MKEKIICSCGKKFKTRLEWREHYEILKPYIPSNIPIKLLGEEKYQIALNDFVDFTVLHKLKENKRPV